MYDLILSKEERAALLAVHQGVLTQVPVGVAQSFLRKGITEPGAEGLQLSMFGKTLAQAIKEEAPELPPL